MHASAPHYVDLADRSAVDAELARLMEQARWHRANWFASRDQTHLFAFRSCMRKRGMLSSAAERGIGTWDAWG